MLLSNFNVLATAPGGVARLRELILTLAVQGKLVPQDAADEPAAVLLEKIQAEKDRLIAAGKIKRDKPLAGVSEEEKPFELPKTWQWTRLEEISITIVDCPHSTAKFVSTGLLCIDTNSFKDGKLLPHKLRYVDEATFAERVARLEPQPGDLVFAREGSVGESVIIPAETVACLGQRVMLFRFSTQVSNEYVRRVITSAGFLKKLLELHKGIGAKHVNVSDMRLAVIPLPPLAEQSRIVTRVEELMHLCDALEAKGKLEAAQHAQLVSNLLATLTESETPEALAANWQRISEHFDLLLDRPEAVDALEQTILQLAVRGLLVPQNPQDEPASVLLQKIRAEKDRLIAEGKIRQDKPLEAISEEEEPFKLPQGWEWIRLENIASQITDGAHHTPTYVKEGIPFLSVKDVSAGSIDFSNTRFIAEDAHAELSKRCNPQLGDLLLTKIGTTGIALVIDTDQPFSLFVSVALIKLPPVSAVGQYLSLLINSPFVRKQSEDGTEGVGNKNLVLRKIKAFQLPLPPLTEQSRIVTQVNTLRRLCADLRQRLAASQATQAQLAAALLEAPAA